MKKERERKRERERKKERGKRREREREGTIGRSKNAFQFLRINDLSI